MSGIWPLLDYCTCINHHKLLIFLIKLCKDCSKSQNILIHMQLEMMTFDMLFQNESTKQNLVFNSWKICFYASPQMNSSSDLVNWVKRFGNLIKPFDKLPLIICQPQKRLQLININWFQNLGNHIHLDLLDSQPSWVITWCKYSIWNWKKLHFPWYSFDPCTPKHSHISCKGWPCSSMVELNTMMSSM